MASKFSSGFIVDPGLDLGELRAEGVPPPGCFWRRSLELVEKKGVGILVRQKSSEECEKKRDGGKWRVMSDGRSGRITQRRRGHRGFAEKRLKVERLRGEETEKSLDSLRSLPSTALRAGRMTILIGWSIWRRGSREFTTHDNINYKDCQL